LVGKPLKASTIDGNLGKLRKFFRDCQEWGWIECRFDPARALQTPRSIRGSLGPDPRVIADDIWAKLLWAGLNLEAADLPQAPNKGYFYPLEMIRALVIVWLFAGLRNDEIRRLRVGCIRRQSESAAATGTGGAPAKGAVCLLDVPINKTGTAFTKAVDRVVGEAVMAWERIRADQPPRFEEKTGEVVNPLSDVRGRITSHRARSTIATQLYNAKEPLSLFELQLWLGHRSIYSTQHYAKISPTKLAQSYANAGYFERNVRTIEVLIDREAILSGAAAAGAPWQYFDLGHGYCTNSFFVTCPHRMACARCDFYLPKGSSQAQMLEARDNLQQMIQKIPLTDDERAAVEEGIEFMKKLCQKLADVPTPAGPTPREIESYPQ
jgi:integrase